MPTPFVSSVSGRLLLTAFAAFTLSAAAYLLYGNMTAFGLGFPIGLTLSFLAVGLGMTEYTRQTLLSMIALPPALWGFMYLTAEFQYHSANNWGYGLALLGVLALGRAAMGGTTTPSITPTPTNH